MRLDSVQSLYGMTGNGCDITLFMASISSGAPCPSCRWRTRVIADTPRLLRFPPRQVMIPVYNAQRL